MPGSLTTPGRRTLALAHPSILPSALGTASASRVDVVFGAPYLAYALPYRRFTPDLAVNGARLGADVGRYSFVAVDFHHLLLAGLPAHTQPTAYFLPLSSVVVSCGQLDLFGIVAMPIYIANNEADRLVRELARRKGLGLTAAVKLAVRNELRREDERDGLHARIAVLRAEVLSRQATGLIVDKAFFDELGGNT